MQFHRFEQLIGKENWKKIQDLKILVIGVGGVGGYVVESLVRCGIGMIIIIDPDRIDETNTNRQIIAMTSTIGRKKVDVWKERIEDISKVCKCIAIDGKIGLEDIGSISKLQQELNITFDFIVDACDDIPAKKAIIRECTKNQIPFISSMGTGKRLDPSKLEITTLDKTSYDPIAKILRKFIRDEKIKQKIIVLASREIPIQTESKEIPSCSFVPASAGLLITSYIIQITTDKK